MPKGRSGAVRTHTTDKHRIKTFLQAARPERASPLFLRAMCRCPLRHTFDSNLPWRQPGPTSPAPTGEVITLLISTLSLSRAVFFICSNGPGFRY